MSFKLLIVNYHYFRCEKPHAGIYPVTPDEFSSQLEVLAKTYSFCSGADIVAWMNAGTTPAGNYCLITFDDGLAEQMEAFDLLVGRGIPAMFYVPVAPFLSKIVLAVHKLHHIRATMRDAQLLELLERWPSFQHASFDTSLIRAQYRYDGELAGKIKYFFNFLVSPDESERIVGHIFDSLVGDNEVFSRALYMSDDDIKKIGRHGMLGAHGVSHRPLANLSGQEIQSEVDESLAYLERLAGTKVNSFSYPYGSRVAVTKEVIERMPGTTALFAVTMFRGINYQEDLLRPFELKRVDTNDAPGGKKPLVELC